MEAGHRGAQAGNGQAALPPQHHLVTDRQHDGVDDDDRRERVLARAIGGQVHDEDAQGHVHLRAGEANAAGAAS